MLAFSVTYILRMQESERKAFDSIIQYALSVHKTEREKEYKGRGEIVRIKGYNPDRNLLFVNS